MNWENGDKDARFVDELGLLREVEFSEVEVDGRWQDNGRESLVSIVDVFGLEIDFLRLESLLVMVLKVLQKKCCLRLLLRWICRYFRYLRRYGIGSRRYF